MLKRSISKVTRSPQHQGFLGSGHIASAIFEGVPYQETDPFIVFMDDRLNFKGGAPVGGAHPHAGFETVTLVLKGNGADWETGSFELMTAGSGIVHTEEISAEQSFHILQVWLALPPEKRWTEPFWQKIKLENVPTIKNSNFEIRVYSGESNGLTSPLKNLTPLTVVDFRMNAQQKVVQELPSNQNGLIYVLEGSVRVGETTIHAGQAGWLDKAGTTGISEITFESGDEKTHFVMYAAQPHHVPIVSHGPFIADSSEEISGLYKAYRSGAMPHLNNLPAEQKLEFVR